MDATFRGGSQVAQMDPVVFISAMAAVTESVAFGVTGSTSYIPPYILARTWSTLDHVTDGRIAWNVVTSYSNSAAKAMGREQVMSHDERYAGIFFQSYSGFSFTNLHSGARIHGPHISNVGGLLGRWSTSMAVRTYNGGTSTSIDYASLY